MKFVWVCSFTNHHPMYQSLNPSMTCGQQTKEITSKSIHVLAKLNVNIDQRQSGYELWDDIVTGKSEKSLLQSE